MDAAARRWAAMTAAALSLAAAHLGWMIAYRNLDIVCGDGLACVSLAGLRALGPILLFETIVFFALIYAASLVWWAAASLRKAAAERLSGHRHRPRA